MEVLLVIANVSASLFPGIVRIWSGITLSRYVKEGKSALVGFTWFWIFNPEWFTEHGQAASRKERVRFVSAVLLVAVLGFGQMKLYG